MITLNCKAILFDLDGTKVDSALRLQRLWQEWGRRHGIDPESIMDVMHGRRAGETISLLAPHLSVRDEVSLLENDEINDMTGVRPYPAAKAILDRLSPGQWAIVTSGSLRVVSARLQHVGLPTPEIFITGDDVKSGKPAPDGDQLAASRLYVNPSDCIVVEDAPAGVQAGKSAGMRVIAIASSTPRGAFNQADFVVQQLEDLSVLAANQEIFIHIQK